MLARLGIGPGPSSPTERSEGEPRINLMGPRIKERNDIDARAFCTIVLRASTAHVGTIQSELAATSNDG
jgi:hypothetical protein